MKIHEILPNQLYQSAEFINDNLNYKLSMLANCNIDIVVNMYKHRDVELEQFLYKYIYFPISDGVTTLNDFKTVKKLVHVAVTMKLQIVNNYHVVLVHCHGGRNRSGLMSALIVKSILNCSGKEALEIVRKGRPRSVDNEHFEKFILHRKW